MGPWLLPNPRDPEKEIEWRLTETGLEWSGGDFNAAWMPFACMRLLTLGNVSGDQWGWRMRISGPPGSVLIYGGAGSQEADFFELSHRVITGAASAGCGTNFRWNDRNLAPPFLWARMGRRMQSADDLLNLLVPSAA